MYYQQIINRSWGPKTAVNALRNDESNIIYILTNRDFWQGKANDENINQDKWWGQLANISSAQRPRTGKGWIPSSYFSAGHKSIYRCRLWPWGRIWWQWWWQWRSSPGVASESSWRRSRYRKPDHVLDHRRTWPSLCCQQAQRTCLCQCKTCSLLSSDYCWQWILSENPTLIITKCAKAPIDRESEDARNGAFILEVTTHYQHNSWFSISISTSQIWTWQPPRWLEQRCLEGGGGASPSPLRSPSLSRWTRWAWLMMIRVNRTQLLFRFSKTNVDNHCWCQAQPMSKDNNNCWLILFSYYSNWISSIYNVGQCQCNILQWVELSDF